MTNLTIMDKTIHTQNNLYSLNDLHKASGNLAKNKPIEFLRQKQSKELLKELELENFKGGNSHLKTIKGRFGGTYACKELVYSYAMWISPKFNLMVIRAFDNLVNQKALPNYATLSPQFQAEVQDLVNQKVIREGFTHQAVYKSIKNHFGVGKYNQLKDNQMPEVREFLGGGLADEVKMPKTDYRILVDRLSQLESYHARVSAMLQGMGKSIDDLHLRHRNIGGSLPSINYDRMQLPVIH